MALNYGFYKNKRIMSYIPSELVEDERLRQKKQKKLEEDQREEPTLSQHTGYWIAEENRWMKIKEAERYLSAAHVYEYEYPLKYAYDYDDRFGTCVHCGKVMVDHPMQTIYTVDGFGEPYEYDHRCCGTAEAPLVGRYAFNKYTYLCVGPVYVLTWAEMNGSDKYTQ